MTVAKVSQDFSVSCLSRPTPYKYIDLAEFFLKKILSLFCLS
nr:MAG TPA: hypothetical protein [Caudoviricetes sp.]